ncbi:hypothetical protein M0R45_011746 [Rubus argutus]|uniref:Uncharacterized protein n=1 Tax=Rubus argutus TaxID=59490 RepID=A0AAW1YEW4_RUBAR
MLIGAEVVDINIHQFITAEINGVARRSPSLRQIRGLLLQILSQFTHTALQDISMAPSRENIDTVAFSGRSVLFWRLHYPFLGLGIIE